MEIEKLLQERGQTHLLRRLPQLTGEERAELERELARVDWALLELAKAPPDLSGRGRLAPIPILSVPAIERDRARYRAAGEELLSRGGAAAVLLAGGQGTRLGTDAPKGTFDIGLTRPLYIFEQLIENLRPVAKACGTVPLFIMTSEQNDAATRAFFEEHAFFGYPKAAVRFFVQETAPCTDFAGRLLPGEGGGLVRSPNGNGGWYSSLVRAGIPEEFPAVEWFNVFAVDNVLQRIADPVFLGATLLSGCDCGAKGVRKCDPDERVGVLCLEDGRPSVIEYYELSEEDKRRRNERGELVYSFGVTLNYLFRAEALKRAARENIPVHVVKKKVPFLGERGERVVPERENGYKFETLILDMVRLMGSCLPFEIVREREFAPIKNRTGTDSVETARALLRANGVEL